MTNDKGLLWSTQEKYPFTAGCAIHKNSGYPIGEEWSSFHAIEIDSFIRSHRKYKNDYYIVRENISWDPIPPAE